MVGKSCSIISVAEDVLVRPAGTIIRPYQWSSALRIAIVASGCPGGTTGVVVPVIVCVNSIPRSFSW